jgi:hypothetical protein
MIPVKSITLTRAEGPTEDCGTITVASWAAATAALRKWAATAPGPGDGYDKCDVTIEWADGERITERYDLVSLDIKTPNLASWFRRLVTFAAGLAKPSTWKSTWTEQTYKAILNRNPKLTDWAKTAYECRDIGHIGQAA